MWKKLLGFACVGLLAACSGADDQAASSEAAATGGISPDAIGEYKLEDNDSFGATLKITSVSPFLFDLTVVRKSGGGAMGDLVQAMARVSDGKATYAPAADCSIVLRPRADGVEVRQAGSCDSEGFGAFVDGTGMYVKKTTAPEQGVILAGQPYARQNDDGLSAGFEITAVTATEMTFNLTAVAEGPSGRHGDIQGGRAKIDGRVATYTAGSDCTITFTFKPESYDADLVQEGPCSEEAGFGAFIDVTGNYAQTEGDELEGG
ncbi:MAG: hypothetical protein KIT84_17175 [Labilithrix sp.]|nr:hypothetical protein [Labilithrix sp.]MCW5812763.1 hypothetical protein [Labilithrix sp.]